MKACPFCAEEIQDAAIVCKHCGRDLPRATAASSTTAPDPPTWEIEARSFLHQGDSIRAIQRIREATGVGLKEAKDLSDKWQAEMGTKPAAAKPAQVSPAAGCGAAVMVIGLLMFAWCNVASNPFGTKGAAPPATANDPSAARAVVTTICEIEVKGRLKSPSTADFPWSHVGSVRPVGGNTYRLASYVDSQNAFGATVRTNFVCDVSGSGSDLQGYRLTNLNLSPQ